MRNLSAIFFFAFALVTLGDSAGGSRQGQVQFAVQPVKIVNTPNDGPFVPVANDPQHPVYVVVGAERQNARPTYEYKVDTYTPPVIQSETSNTPPKIDNSKLQPSFEAFLNNHSEWEVVNVPTTFELGPNIIAFRRQK
jgi:hypothetical protein